MTGADLGRVLGQMLCTVNVHHVPDERRRWTSIGWFGHCTRCGTKRSGIGGAQ